MSTLTRRRFISLAGTISAITAGATLSGCSQSGKSKALELFQFKSEAIAYFNEVCKKYTQEHPQAGFFQNFQADNVTALRVRLVKDQIPEVITINGDYSYGAIAKSGVFYDFTQTDLLGEVNPTVAQILPSLGRSAKDAVNGLPMSNNGSGIIYNKRIFDSVGIQPPRTWQELLDVCEKLKAAGIDPFYWAFKDDWIAAPMFNSISGNLLPESVASWYAKRLEGQVTFREGLKDVFTKMAQLAAYGNSNRFELGYNDGNQGFAQERAAMYVHGTYAIPAIRSYNPDINLGTFAMPADNEADTKVVSGVDVAITMGADPAHLEENLEFIKFLMNREGLAQYCKEQVAFPPLTGMSTSDPALEGLAPYFEQQRLATYSDHNFSPAMNLNASLQQFIFGESAETVLTTLDKQWDKVTRRIKETTRQKP